MSRAYNLSEAFSRSVPEADIERVRDAAIHRWRRTRVMASANVGAGLAYHAAVRWMIERRFCNAWAARATQENRPIMMGVVRAMARSDHWRWISTPR